MPYAFCASEKNVVGRLFTQTMMEIKHVNNNMAIIAKTHSFIAFCAIVSVENELPYLGNFISSLRLSYDTYIYVIFDLVSDQYYIKV